MARDKKAVKPADEREGEGVLDSLLNAADDVVEKVEGALGAPAQPGVIAHGSKEHENLLAGAYGMDREKAEELVALWKTSPASWLYPEYKRASAFLEALNAKPVVVSTVQPIDLR